MKTYLFIEKRNGIEYPEIKVCWTKAKAMELLETRLNDFYGPDVRIEIGEDFAWVYVRWTEDQDEKLFTELYVEEQKVIS